MDIAEKNGLAKRTSVVEHLEKKGDIRVRGGEEGEGTTLSQVERRRLHVGDYMWIARKIDGTEVSKGADERNQQATGVPGLGGRAQDVGRPGQQYQTRETRGGGTRRSQKESTDILQARYGEQKQRLRLAPFRHRVRTEESPSSHLFDYSQLFASTVSTRSWRQLRLGTLTRLVLVFECVRRRVCGNCKDRRTTANEQLANPHSRSSIPVHCARLS